MCFSVAVDKNIKKVSEYFSARISTKESTNLQNLFNMQETMDSEQFDRLMGIKHKANRRSTPFKEIADDGKVFPNYFTEVVIGSGTERSMLPMRYRVRPQGSNQEVPTKFNVYNARIDSLEERKTWRPLFMANHGLVPFIKFYEWVPGPDGKPKLITFLPEEREIMWAPCLWDEWASRDGQIHFKSFAIVTDDPPKEISMMGHDRCPIFLKSDYIDEWLNPQSSTKNEIYEILKQKEDVKFLHSWT